MLADESASVADVMQCAARLEAQGRLLETIEFLTTANRADRNAEIETELVQLRHRAFAEMHSSKSREPWPPAADGPFPNTNGPPELSPRQLDGDAIARGILNHGCLIVRGLFGYRHVQRLLDDIDRAFDAREAAKSGAPVEETRPWFVPFRPGVGRPDTFDNRNHVRTVDSPGSLFDLREAFEDVGLGPSIASYMGERPALSVNKCELRRVPPAVGPVDFHQDGAFLGAGIRTVNVWLSLSHCGVEAAGMDIVPRRIKRVLPTGIDGAVMDWTLSPVTVTRELDDPPVVRPVFAPGDVLLFDELMIHRTANEPTMTATRYAAETWFFAPSVYPSHHLPLVF
jgi:hypothetical protein